MRGAELNPRLRAVFIMPEQLLNLRRRAALPVLGLLHPFSKPDSSLTGNQGVAHTLTFNRLVALCPIIANPLLISLVSGVQWSATIDLP